MRASEPQTAETHASDLELARRCTADAAAQETFIEVFRSIDRFRGQAALGSWIHRIAVRTTLRHRKRERHRWARLSLLGAEEPATPAGDSLDRRRALDRVYRLLGRLNETRRAAFILHEVEQRSLAETAALLGISVSAAKKKASRGRAQLERWARADDLLALLFEEPGAKP
jgi:RNA polymerase sigma-70 factor (ECF subfamily)